MNDFQFNQHHKEMSCGWRCLHYVIPEQMSYEQFLDQFKYLRPGKRGITFKMMTSVLDYYNTDYLFTIPRKRGLYIIWAGQFSWPTYKHPIGHYFIYHDEMILNSLDHKPVYCSILGLRKMLETKDSSKHYIALQIQ